MGSGIPAHNINVWDGSKQDPFAIQPAIVADPSTGDLYGSTTMMQDDPHIRGSWAEADYCPRIVTLGSLVGNLAAAMGIK